MKKFTKILICLLLTVFSLGFVACGNTPDVKDLTTGVRGNGGLVVQKGDYIYFVNGYASADDVESRADNEIVASLMRGKVSSDNSITDCVVVTNKLCGFESTGLYAFGNYIYFTTPCLEKVYDEDLDENVLANDRVQFCRVKIGDTKIEKIYTSQVANKNLTYEYYAKDSSLYLLAYESGADLDDSSKTDVLKRVEIGKNKTLEIATNVDSVVFDDDLVYYSATKDSDYSLNSYNPFSNKVESILNKDKEITIKAVRENFVYFTISNSIVSSNVDLNRLNTNNNQVEFVCNATDFKDTMYITNDCHVIAVSDNMIQVYIGISNLPKKISEDENSINVIDVLDGSIIYYDSKNVVKSVSYSNVIAGADAEIEELATVENVKDSQIDIDAGYLYFYKTVGSNKYLHRIKIVNNVNDEVEMVGVYLEQDNPETDSSTEE